ncbi:MAG: hypothetical protein K2W96_20175 [Gemmataceae bacterium]|nr:hypothetical protein [Gemmataceae bacterium]
MGVRLRIPCPACDVPTSAALPAPAQRECPACGHAFRLADPQGDPLAARCACCGNAELYKKKDFPHGLGMLVLVGGFVASTIAYAWYDIRLVWAILLGTAAFDTLLYFLVGDVVACYRCGTEHRGLAKEAAHAPHEMIIEER